MVRQCAWCLRLIDAAGERISTAPLPKLYEATHGMCSICGALWIEQVLSCQDTQVAPPAFQDSTNAEASCIEEGAEKLPIKFSLYQP